VPGRRSASRGVTLLEMLVAVTLLGLLSGGILLALHAGVNAMGKARAKLMDNRRMAGVQRIMEQQIAGFVPVLAQCQPQQGTLPASLPFFQGEPQSMRFVSSFSLAEGWRGRPLILEFQVIPGELGAGVRLVVNELMYAGPQTAGASCTGLVRDDTAGVMVPMFRPIAVGPQSFVLADRLSFCRFSFMEQSANPPVSRWVSRWILPRWPSAVRIEMAPLEADAVRLRPLTLTAPVRVTAEPGRNYER